MFSSLASWSSFLSEPPSPHVIMSSNKLDMSLDDLAASRPKSGGDRGKGKGKGGRERGSGRDDRSVRLSLVLFVATKVEIIMSADQVKTKFRPFDGGAKSKRDPSVFHPEPLGQALL